MSIFKKFTDFSKAKDMKDGLAQKDYTGELSLKPTKDALPYKNFDPDKGQLMVADGGKEEEGLADKGTPGMKPSLVPGGEKPKVDAKVMKPTKMKTEEFLKLTKDMSVSELSKFLNEAKGKVDLTTVTDLFGNEFTPDPDQSIEYVVGLIMGNPNLMERFAMEVKRRDGMNDLLQEFLQHNDSYEVLIDHFEHPESGADNAGKMVRMMNDKYLKNFDNFDFGDKEEENDEDGFDFGESISPGLNQIMPEPEGMTERPQVAGGEEKPSFVQNKIKPMYKGNASAGHNFIEKMSAYPDYKNHMISKCIGGNC